MRPPQLAVVGRGLIGGSLEKAARRCGYAVEITDRGEAPRVAAADFVFVAVPPAAVEGVVRGLVGKLKPGAVVVDMTGVKSVVMRSLSDLATARDFVFVGGHPMAGKEKTGYANATAGLFDGASMILVPFPGGDGAVIARLRELFTALGFGRIVVTDAAHHDEMIAFTSQLCHLISSAYVREDLARDHVGYSAGSFRDLSRVGAPDPDIWTDLFFANAEALAPVLARYIARLEDFAAALAAGDRERLHRALAEGVAAKAAFERGLE